MTAEYDQLGDQFFYKSYLNNGGDRQVVFFFIYYHSVLIFCHCCLLCPGAREKYTPERS